MTLSKKMKIYLYLKHFPAHGEPLIGGTSKSVHGFASGLAACGAEVIILCEGKIASSERTNFGYRIECFPNHQKYRTFSISPDLQKYIVDRISKDALVILNGIFHLSVYSISRLLKQHSLPYVVMPHGVYALPILNKNPYLKWSYWYLFERRMLMDAKALQVLEKHQADWLDSIGVRKPIIVTPNGYFPEDIPSISLNWHDCETPKLFFFGRIDIQIKGLDLLLEAFTEVSQDIDLQLTIQGADSKDKQKLQENFHSLCVEEHVVFLEADYATAPTLIMSKYDIFCLPSRSEGFGLSALEAMLVGRVLLVSNVAGIAPHIEASGCGVVVAPEVSAIKAGLLDLLERRSQWQEMGLRGRQYALEYLNWNKIAASALEQYQQLMPGSELLESSRSIEPEAC
jgi:glycosyltransferase involved in cell wall biosynthesis